MSLKKTWLNYFIDRKDVPDEIIEEAVFCGVVGNIGNFLYYERLATPFPMKGATVKHLQVLPQL
jgi:hypothetical protein